MNLSEKKLVNLWILNQFSILQDEYFCHFNNKEINQICNKLIRFVKEKISKEYLELTKFFLEEDSETKKILLFVYQQSLLMLHPITPFITEKIYQNITHEKILNVKLEKIEKKENENLWQIDFLLILLNSIRKIIQQDNNINFFYLKMQGEWETKLDRKFDFNFFLEPLKRKIILIDKISKFNKFYSTDLNFFGVLYYEKKKNLEEQKEKLNKKLEFYEKELKRCESLLNNKKFSEKAPLWLKKQEEKKLKHYQEMKKKIFQELEKINHK